ncbi:MAG: BamA/TamA family outer membrane protein [Mariniphaga sp.]|nr:BamA/TamA family outer membrane protein [Mariniphaga sp.]
MIRKAFPYGVILGRFLALAAGLFLFSCSSVKYVPESQYLLNKVEVETDGAEIGREELKTHIRQKENYKILGFIKFHLWLYNLSSAKKESSWLRKIGEPPEIFDEGLVFASEERLRQYLANRGFFRASVTSDIRLNDSSQKARVKYKVNTGDQYKIREINYHFRDSALEELFFRDSAGIRLNPGIPFDLNLLDQKRSAIVDLYKNDGYYYFSKDEVSFLADSNRYDQEVILDLFIGGSPGTDALREFRQYQLNDFYISVLPGSVPVSSPEGYTQFSDTLRWENHTLYSSGEIQYRQGLFRNLIQMKTGSLYRLDDARYTFDVFTRLRQFRFIDLQFSEAGVPADTSLLDCYIRLAPLSKQAISFDVEGTNTSGNLGMAGNVNYQHRNVLKGAEVFQMNLRGAMERQQRMVENVPEYFNTRELGTEASLTFPKILGPRQVVAAFRNFLPKTVFTVGFNYQQRPEYTRTISNIKLGYDWMTSENRKHTWNLVDFNRIDLSQFDAGFIDFIKDLYIRSSFTDHLIFATNYSFIYNTQRPGTMQNYSFMRFNVESAGNLAYLVSETLNRPLTQSADSVGAGSAGYYRIFNTRFAQYIKSDVEIRRGIIMDRYNTLVGRAFFGVGLPYGNFDVLPFEKKYFTGGANGIRAWQVRSLGPGTYKSPPNAYPNQSADIKLEANLEYRFNLLDFLEGALFVDAGNIWAINRKDNRPGAQFKINQFYKQLALGTGTGFRFDFNYFIFRLDVGMKLRDPSETEANGWIIGQRKYTGDDFNFSFAIGYPF